jgi:TRAP-type uncharacterized transport system substrate-binding protein
MVVKTRIPSSNKENMTRKSKHEELYSKYMAFNNIMLEDYKPAEIAAIMAVQAFSFYKTIMDEDDYLKIIDTIYENRHNVKTFDQGTL